MYYPQSQYIARSIPNTRYILPINRPTNQSNYPEVDPTQLTESAHAFQALMDEAQKILHAFSSSKEFSYQVMSAAQVSNKQKVEKLIADTGVSRPVDIEYNPDSIKLILHAKTKDVDCCKLSMALHW